MIRDCLKTLQRNRPIDPVRPDQFQQHMPLIAPGSIIRELMLEPYAIHCIALAIQT
jgi:hypothetical protein